MFLAQLLSSSELYFWQRALLLLPCSIVQELLSTDLPAPHRVALKLARYKLTQVLSWITLFALLLFQCIYLLFVRRGDFALFSRCLERRSLHSWKDRRYVREVPAFKLSWRRGRDGEDHRGWQTSKSTSYSFPPHHICETCFPSYLQQFQLM